MSSPNPIECIIHSPRPRTARSKATSWSPPGYTGVWAEENTRAAIWDAMERKEVYATTGPRMTVRFFGGWDYTPDDLNSRLPAFRGYEKGVPMGGRPAGTPRRQSAHLHGLRAARSDRRKS